MREAKAGREERGVSGVVWPCGDVVSSLKVGLDSSASAPGAMCGLDRPGDPRYVYGGDAVVAAW